TLVLNPAARALNFPTAKRLSWSVSQAGRCRDPSDAGLQADKLQQSVARCGAWSDSASVLSAFGGVETGFSRVGRAEPSLVPPPRAQTCSLRTASPSSASHRGSCPAWPWLHSGIPGSKKQRRTRAPAARTGTRARRPRCRCRICPVYAPPTASACCSRARTLAARSRSCLGTRPRPDPGPTPTASAAAAARTPSWGPCATRELRARPPCGPRRSPSAPRRGSPAAPRLPPLACPRRAAEPRAAGWEESPPGPRPLRLQRERGRGAPRGLPVPGPGPSASPPLCRVPFPERLGAEGTVALGRAGDALRLAAEYCPGTGRLRLRLLRAEGLAGGAPGPAPFAASSASSCGRRAPRVGNAALWWGAAARPPLTRTSASTASRRTRCAAWLFASRPGTRAAAGSGAACWARVSCPWAPSCCSEGPAVPGALCQGTPDTDSRVVQNKRVFVLLIRPVSVQHWQR
uniref:Uncharacterized protein n=1 Tax=Macaca fascicularis TaxID=9541 RepID=A0A7N9D7Y1_MACFA